MIHKLGIAKTRQPLVSVPLAPRIRPRSPFTYSFFSSIECSTKAPFLIGQKVQNHHLNSRYVKLGHLPPPPKRVAAWLPSPVLQSRLQAWLLACVGHCAGGFLGEMPKPRDTGNKDRLIHVQTGTAQIALLKRYLDKKRRQDRDSLTFVITSLIAVRRQHRRAHQYLLRICRSTLRWRQPCSR